MNSRDILLVAVNCKERDKELCKEAIHYAKTMHMSVTFIHVIEYIPCYDIFPFDNKKVKSLLEEEIATSLTVYEHEMTENGLRVNPPVIAEGSIADVICEKAEEVNAMAIMVNADESFLFDAWIESADKKIARLANRNVIIVKAKVLAN